MSNMFDMKETGVFTAVRASILGEHEAEDLDTDVIIDPNRPNKRLNVTPVDEQNEDLKVTLTAMN